MKIPQKLFVVTRKEKDYPLGFWHEYLPGNKAFEKKKQTQLSWAYTAYNDMSVGSVEEVNGLYILNCIKYNYNGSNYAQSLFKFPADPQPFVLDNEFLSGFKILGSKSRYSTSNKVWRILDPRGIQFEISSGAMAHILLSTTVQKGEIMEKCCWGSDGNHKILVLESEK